MTGQRVARIVLGVAFVLAVATSLAAETAPPAPPAGPLGVGPAGGLAGEAQPEWLRGVLTRVNAAQRQLNQALSRELRRLRGGEVTSAALAVAWIVCLPFNPSRYSEDQLRPFAKVVGSSLRGTPPVEPQTQGGGRPRQPQ
jgi:hypothetical protein